MQQVMIDPPSPFAPKSELQTFLRQNQARKEPEVREAVQLVRGYLAKYPAGFEKSRRKGG